MDKLTVDIRPKKDALECEAMKNIVPWLSSVEDATNCLLLQLRFWRKCEGNQPWF